jgi:hypothetical protein
MSAKDLVHNVKATAAYAGGTISSDTDTAGGITIDTQGFESVSFLLYMGAITTGTATLKIMETDNSDGTTGITEVPAYQVQGVFTKSPTDDSNKVKKVGAVVSKRYAVLRITTGSTANLVVKGAIALLGGAHDAPVA